MSLLLLRSEWYDYCQKLNAFHVLGAEFRPQGDLTGAFGAHRPRHARAFDAADKRTMALLLVRGCRPRC